MWLAADQGLTLRDWATILTALVALLGALLAILKWRSDKERDTRNDESEAKRRDAAADVTRFETSYKVLENHIIVLTKENHDLRAEQDKKDTQIERQAKEIVRLRQHQGKDYP